MKRIAPLSSALARVPTTIGSGRTNPAGHSEAPNRGPGSTRTGLLITARKGTPPMTDRHGTPVVNPVHVEETHDPCPLFRYRATCGALHAVGPTMRDAVATLERAMGVSR